MDLRLSGKRVLITGASRGIGAEAARVFAEEGCDLLLAARDIDALTTLSDRLIDTYQVKVDVSRTDLRDPAALSALGDLAADADILVNNAGDLPAGTLEQVDDPAWRHGWELKVFGYINLTRRVYAHMKARGGGVIINNIGASGERFDGNYIAGSAGNAALMAFSRTLGGQSLKDNIRVVGVNPAPVETDRIVALMKVHARNRFNDENRYRDIMSSFPLGRPATTTEIADAMAFLASPRSGYTSGVILTIDGGLCATGL